MTEATAEGRDSHLMEIFLLFQVNRNTSPEQEAIHLFVNNSGVQTLGVLDVDGLNVGVESLLGALLVVTLAGDADTEAERNTLDTSFPDLLVQLGVEADILGALIGGRRVVSWIHSIPSLPGEETYHSLLGEGADLLDSTRSALLESNTVHL